MELKWFKTSWSLTSNNYVPKGQSLSSWTYFKPMFSFHTPWYYQKTINFLVFSGGTDSEHWPETDNLGWKIYQREEHALYKRINPFDAAGLLLYTLKTSENQGTILRTFSSEFFRNYHIFFRAQLQTGDCITPFKNSYNFKTDVLQLVWIQNRTKLNRCF